MLVHWAGLGCREYPRSGKQVAQRWVLRIYLRSSAGHLPKQTGSLRRGSLRLLLGRRMSAGWCVWGSCRRRMRARRSGRTGSGCLLRGWDLRATRRSGPRALTRHVERFGGGLCVAGRLGCGGRQWGWKASTWRFQAVY